MANPSKAVELPAGMQEAIESIVDGWFDDTQIDWHDFLDRLEKWGFDLGEDMSSPLIRKIQKHARVYKNLS